MRPRTRRNGELENSIHARGTRAGTEGGEAQADGWSVPACVPHAEEEELESSTHARGTRAGTIGGEALVDGWSVPACVLARGGMRNWKVPFTPAGRGRVR